MSVSGVSKIKISAIGQYEGYSEKVFDGRSRYSFYFPSDDGVRIAVDYYIPTRNGKETEERLPVIFHYTPYGRIMYAKEAGELYGVEGEALYFDDWGIEGLLDLTDYGYVVAIADVRGTGASFGARKTTNSRREAEDGKLIIEWLAKAPFSNGKVGTAGYSYTGQTQLECISTCPEGLTAQFLCMTDYNKYDGWVRGCIPRAFGTQPDTQFGETEEEIAATIEGLAEKTVPVDEDPDKTLLRQAIAEHRFSGSQIEIMKSIRFRDAYIEEAQGELCNIISASAYKDKINSTGCAVYLVGGVYDVFRRDTFIMYENMELPKKMLLGPWYHMDQKADVRWDLEMRRWFDYWLKGIDNGIMDEEPITFRMANYNFKRHDIKGPGTGYYLNKISWPLHQGTRKTYYPDPSCLLTGSAYDNGGLTETCPVQAEAEFSDPYGTQTSIETPLTTNEQGTGIDQQGLTYTSAPLGEELEIVGHPEAYVNFSLEDPGFMTEDYDVDFYVSLSDYHPETDEAFLITEGQLRASMRKTCDNPSYDFLGLPWHRGNQADAQYLNLGEKYHLAMDMMPTSYVVRKGHCLRVTITNSMDRMYYHGREEYEKDPDLQKPVVKVYFGGMDATRVVLPNIYR